MGCAHGTGKQDPLLLAAGEVPVALILQVRNFQSLHVFTGPFFFHTGIKRPQSHPVEASGHHDLPDTCRKVLLDLSLLGKITDLCRFQPFAHLHPAGGRPFQTQESLDQGALSGAVFTDDTKIITFLHGKVQVADHRDAVIGERQVFAFQ